MKMIRRRFLALALCVCLTGMLLVPAGAEEAPAQTASEEMLTLVKAWEGFLPAYSGGYIGYGTAVSASAYPGGITEAEAETLLRQTMDTLCAQITQFFAKRGVTLSQQQLDALASLSYNVGTGWLRDSYRLVKTIVAGGYSDQALASALGVWCHVGKTIDLNLARHRAAEAAIFLYGDYSGTGGRFCHVIYDAAGGEVDTDIEFFPEGEPYGVLQTPTGSGYFAGWYTASGERVRETDTAQGSCTLYARWSDSPVTEEPEDKTPDDEIPEDETPDEPDAPEEPETSPRASFPDVPEDAWYGAQMARLVDAGIVSGFGDGTFRPGGTVSRAQALKLVLRACGIEPLEADASAGWAAGYYAAAVAGGYLAEDAWDDLSQPTTRLEIAQLAAAALGLSAEDVAAPFTDTDDPAAAATWAAGIFEGMDDGAGGLKFAPERSITRAQVCAVICRIMDRKASANALEGY